MNNLTTFVTLVFWWVLVGLNFQKKKNHFGLIFQKSCMPKIESTSDLEAICSSAKTRLKALIIDATKLLTFTHILDFIEKTK
jgi:hypothetical protein